MQNPFFRIALVVISGMCALAIAIIRSLDAQKLEAQPRTLVNHLALTCARWNVLLTVFLSLIVIAIAGHKEILELLQPQVPKKKIRQRIMSMMMEELFDKNKGGHVRITIFKDAGRLRHWKFYWTLWWRWKRKVCELSPEKGKYVYVKERLGTEFADSNTFLFYDPNTRTKVSGIAGFVRQSREQITVPDLPDLTKIDLNNVNLNDSKDQRVVLIKDYMNRGMVDFDTLKRINVKGRHFFGTMLTDKDGEPKGVLVVDSTGENSPFNSTTETRLEYYAKMLNTAM